MSSTTTQTATLNGKGATASIARLSASATSSPDEFDAAEFEQGRESLPYLQMLNHQDPNQSGFFITSANRSAVQFTPIEEWSLHTTTFQNGEVVEGYRSLIARFLILRKSKLLMFDRESGEFLREYRKDLYDRASMVLKVRYLVYLVNQQKQLLHEKPLQFTTKGSFCGSFGEAVRDFQNEMSKAYGAATGAKKPRGDYLRKCFATLHGLVHVSRSCPTHPQGREKQILGVFGHQSWHSYSRKLAIVFHRLSP